MICIRYIYQNRRNQDSLLACLVALSVDQPVDLVIRDAGLGFQTFERPDDHALFVQDKDSVGVGIGVIAGILVFYIQDHRQLPYLPGIAVEQGPVVVEALLARETGELGGIVSLCIERDEDETYLVLFRRGQAIGDRFHVLNEPR